MTAWLVLHVIAAIGGMGPEMAFGIMGPAARRRGAAAASAIYEGIAAARARLVYPMLALQVASGVALIRLHRHSVLDERWLLSALVLYGVAVVIVGAVLAPGAARARRALAAGTDPRDPSMRRLWTRQAAAGGLAGSMLVTVAVLMVWKP